MTKATGLAQKLSTAKGWSVQEKYPYPLLDAEGNTIETLYIRPLSRAKYKDIVKKMEDAKDDSSRLTLRMVVECCFLQDGSKAFSAADIPMLMTEVSSTQLNELEMAVLNAGRKVSIDEEKKG